MPEDVLTALEEKRLQGIEGWLVWPVLYLVVVAFSCADFLVDSELPRLRPEILAGNLALLIGAVVLLAVLHRKLSITPPLMIVFYVLCVAVSALEYVTLTSFAEGIDPAVVEVELAKASEALGTTLANAIIWIPYFVASVRVRNTFVE